jgi:hypothetical protein
MCRRWGGVGDRRRHAFVEDHILSVDGALLIDDVNLICGGRVVNNTDQLNWGGLDRHLVPLMTLEPHHAEGTEDAEMLYGWGMTMPEGEWRCVVRVGARGGHVDDIACMARSLCPPAIGEVCVKQTALHAGHDLTVEALYDTIELQHV